MDKVRIESANAIMSITTHNNNMLEKMDKNNATLLQSLTPKVTSVETTGIQTYLNKWNNLGNEMMKSHAKLDSSAACYLYQTD